MNLVNLTAQFEKAVEIMERRWTILRHDQRNPRAIARYIRSLRHCQRLRDMLGEMLEKGKL